MSIIPINDIPITWSYPLLGYLRTAWLPGWNAFPIDDIQGQHITLSGRARRWARYDALKRPPGTRALRCIVRIPLSELQRLSKDFMDNLPNIMIEGTAHSDTGSIKLPNPDFIDLDNNDRKRLAEDVNVKRDLSMLVQDYVLCTLSEALRLIHGIPPGPKRATRYEFQYDKEIRYPDTRWDIFTLSGHDEESNDMIVVTIPPWWFGAKDLDDFTQPRQIPSGALDTLESPRRNINVLWAVILDACMQTNCYYFAVTTYDSWVFGNFWTGYTAAHVTPWFHAPVNQRKSNIGEEFIEHPKTANSGQTGFMERLLYWAHRSCDSHQFCNHRRRGPCKQQSGTFAVMKNRIFFPTIPIAPIVGEVIHRQGTPVYGYPPSFGEWVRLPPKPPSLPMVVEDAQHEAPTTDTVAPPESNQSLTITDGLAGVVTKIFSMIYQN